MNKHDSLIAWVECQKLFTALFENPIEYGSTWPSKLGLGELAAMQTIDRPQDRDGWLRALSMSGDALKVEIIKLTRNTGFAVIDKDLAFVTPRDFSEYLKSINEQPSRLVAAWFEATSIDFLSDDSNDGLHDALMTISNELKRRDEQPYDGVFGCPPDSVTENERERFKSIRNRLLDGEGYTEADIRGLINDCDANTHSFSLIPDWLKQDIRFLASLWRVSKITEPQAEILGHNKTLQRNARTRKTNLIRAIEAAVKAFGNKPSFEELWKYFDDGKDSTGFIEDITDTKLVWRDTKGKYKDVLKRTVENHLSRIKL